MLQTLQKIITTLTGIVLALQASIAALPPETQLAQATAPTNGLVGYWNFDEGSGTVANDTSGNGNNGTINGATWVAGPSSRAKLLRGKESVSGAFTP